jgi:hypothetical protein
VANHFPVLPAMQLSALQYVVGFTDISGPFNSIQADTLRLVNFGFQRGTDGSGNILTDYSLFDQDGYEANLKTMLNGMSANLAANLGVTAADVQAVITVTRTWFFYAAAPSAGGAYQGITTTDLMPYP